MHTWVRSELGPGYCFDEETHIEVNTTIVVWLWQDSGWVEERIKTGTMLTEADFFLKNCCNALQWRQEFSQPDHINHEYLNREQLGLGVFSLGRFPGQK